MGVGPVTDEGASSTQVLPGVRAIAAPEASTYLVTSEAEGRVQVPATHEPARHTSAGPVPVDAAMGWCEPLGSSMNELIVTGTDCTTTFCVEMTAPLEPL